jgi:hypothetical protein
MQTTIGRVAGRLGPALMFAVLLSAGGAAMTAQEGKTYGKGVNLERAVPVATLLQSPVAHVGKAVRVDGVVTRVCESMGCWLEIADAADGRGVRFKAKDGVIVFPKDASGRKVSAQGVFEEIATSPVREAHAEHSKSTGSSGKPDAPAPTDKIYWVRATGAVLY